MNVPAIAQKTFDESRHDPEMSSIVNDVIENLAKLSSERERADFVHNLVDQYNSGVFSHPLVQQYSPCKMGCSACCHTQVSVTEEEAKILSERINNGINIDENLLKLQMAAKESTDAYFRIPYADRKCIFLDEQGACRVYEDRPSVCRTNVVLGTSDQCDTSDRIQPLRLVKTPKSDMVIYAAFLFSKKNGTLPLMIGKLLGF